MFHSALYAAWNLLSVCVACLGNLHRAAQQSHSQYYQILSYRNWVSIDGHFSGGREAHGDDPLSHVAQVQVKTVLLVSANQN